MHSSTLVPGIDAESLHDRRTERPLQRRVRPQTIRETTDDDDEIEFSLEVIGLPKPRRFGSASYAALGGFLAAVAVGFIMLVGTAI